MRARHRHWLSGLLAIGIGGSAAGLPGLAAAGVLVEEQHAASRLRVSGLAGSLRIDGQNRADIRLEMRGSEAALERLRRDVRGDRLEVTAEPGPRGVTTIISGRNNIVIATPGARATQIIGGVATTVGGPPSEPPLEVQAYVPAGTPLIVEGMVGELMVEGVGGRVELEQAGGSARLDRVAGGRLAVVGGSRIEARAASGDLALEVRGAGDVVVDQADLGGLEVGISGSGNVRVGGSAQQARVTVQGVGNVSVDEVRERPEVRVSGIGQIDIGNW
jgi:Putative auto-transporter adhesin, head GIN domain